MDNKVSDARLRQDLLDIEEEEKEEAMAKKMRMDSKIQSGINRQYLNEGRADRKEKPLPLVPQVSDQKLKILKDESLADLNRKNRLYSMNKDSGSGSGSGEDTDTGGGYRGVKKRSYKKRSYKKRSYKKRSYKKRNCKK
jgi:hypothetical protein